MTTEAMRAAFGEWWRDAQGAPSPLEIWAAATMAERERCAVLCMTFDDTHEANRGHGPEMCAEAIRKGETP